MSTATSPHQIHVDLQPACNDADDTIGEVQRHYVKLNNAIKVLVVLCCGLFQEDGTTALLDETTEPWSLLKSMMVKPSAQELKDEVVRRFKSTPNPNSKRAP
jgi:hypothetical protein